MELRNNIMLNDAEVDEALGCDSSTSGFESRRSTHKKDKCKNDCNKCPFCSIACGEDWCSYN